MEYVPVDLILSETQIAPYEILKIELPADAKPSGGNAGILEVNIGGIQTNAYLAEDSSTNNSNHYYLIVPEAPPGIQKVTAYLAGDFTGESTITILSFNKIADPSLYIRNLDVAAQQNIIQAGENYDEQVLAGHLQRSTADSMKQFLQQAYLKNKAVVDSLPASEKQAYVQLWEANKNILTVFKQVFAQNPVTSYRVAAPGDCESIKAEYDYFVLNGLTDTENRLKIKVDACNTERQASRLDAVETVDKKTSKAFWTAWEKFRKTDGFVAAPKAFFSTFASEISKEVLETQTGHRTLNEAFGVKEIEDTEQRQRTMAQEFVVNQEYGYAAGVKLVNVNRQDAASINGYAEIIRRTEVFNSFMGFIGQFLPYTPNLKVPEQKTKKVYVSGYSIDQISDQRISISIKEGGKGNVIKVGLNSAVTDNRINFSFRVNFSTSFGSSSKRIDAVAVVTPDTTQMLISHGTWKALEGIDEDGDPLRDTGSFSNFNPVCNTTDIHYGSKDSLHLKFNSNGTGVYSLWGKDWGTKQGPNCTLVSYFDPYNADLPFTWQFVAAEKKIRITFPFKFFAIPANQGIDFRILSISANRLELTANTDPLVTPDWYYRF